MENILQSLDETTKKNVLNWLEGPYDEETKKAIRHLLQNNIEELKNAFFQKLSFGTGGARGIMGVGTNRINIYTIRFVAQGLANYLLKEKTHPSSVLIGYDNRNQSALFGEEVAKVLAGNGIKTYLFNELRPTPLVSFGCRHLHCQAAVMITASHNPPSYNGIKVYGSDGGQVLPPYDEMIIHEVNSIENPQQVHIAPANSPLIDRITDSLDRAYLKTISKLQLIPTGYEEEKKNLHVIYTNLHGTGITLIPQAMESFGFLPPTLVQKQATIDGNFPFAPLPNPEEPKALALGIEMLKNNKNADLLLASDPDADRLGVVVHHEGKEKILSGNQIGAILLFHIASSLAANGQLQPGSAIIKSIVTTDLLKEIASSFDVSSFDVLTGFKYIGEKMTQWEKNKNFSFLFGAEESLGFLYGTHARDKDAVIAACLICEAAAKAKKEGHTLVDLLYSIYKRYGVYREGLLSLSFEEGKKGMAQMEQVMKKLREVSLEKIGNYSVEIIEDYHFLTSKNIPEKTTSPLNFPTSDVLTYILQDGSKLVIRPSGTEPKIKIYALVYEKEFPSIEEGIAICDERVKALMHTLKEEIVSIS